MISNTIRNFQFTMIARRLQASPIIRKESVFKVAASLANWNPPVAYTGKGRATVH